MAKPWYLCNNSQGRQSHHANLTRSQAGSLTMATPSHARAVKSLNKSPGLHGRRFVVRLSLSLPTTHDLNNFFFYLVSSSFRFLMWFIPSVLILFLNFCCCSSRHSHRELKKLKLMFIQVLIKLSLPHQRGPLLCGTALSNLGYATRPCVC